MSKADKLLKRIEFYEKMASSQKPENEDLLKKASLYERLALYSDRKSFLSALAQTGGATDDWGRPALPANIREAVDSLMKDLAATKPDSVQMQNRLMNFYQGMNTDLGQLAQAVSEAANLIPGDHTVQVQNALNLAEKVRQMAAKPQAEPQSGDQTMVMPTDKIVALRPIDKTQQEALARFLTVNGIAFVDPQKLNDGKLGPETRKGLESFKKWYNAKATGKKITSDDEALKLVKYIVDNDPTKYGT
jgi:hypothetical protein